MKEYFSFNKLSLNKKILFVLYLLCGAALISAGIMQGNINTICLGMFSSFMALNQFREQYNENLIDFFNEERVECLKILMAISSTIKNDDKEALEKIAEEIDKFLEKILEEE